MVQVIEKPLGLDSPIVEAVMAIEATNRRIAVVVSENCKLLGTLTDGDIRRFILSGGNLESTVASAMNPNPISAQDGCSDSYILDLMRVGNIMALPLVDKNGLFVRLVHRTDLLSEKNSRGESDFAFAVIMAGGEGMRLRPITDKIPKPMVDICGVPLLERQIQRLARAGLSRIYLSVNYLSHVIEDYFGDGSCFGLEIRYLREKEKLGTGGALSLLPETPSTPIIVMNGDILTTFDFISLNDFHKSQGAEITLAAVNYCVDIPFGVVQNSGFCVTGLVEKPSQRFLCNAGIYVLDPAILKQLPNSRAFNMTDIIDCCLAASKKVSVFPVHEYWSDIGTPADLDKARSFFSEKA
jgi:dTDP-glucose pyrophosphorylase